MSEVFRVALPGSGAAGAGQPQGRKASEKHREACGVIPRVLGATETQRQKISSGQVRNPSGLEGFPA